jgi:DNA-binding transcriptional regulator LsrR (DeoR family)
MTRKNLLDTLQQERLARVYKQDGLTLREIAQRFNISVTYAQKILERHKFHEPASSRS